MPVALWAVLHVLRTYHFVARLRRRPSPRHAAAMSRWVSACGLVKALNGRWRPLPPKHTICTCISKTCAKEKRPSLFFRFVLPDGWLRATATPGPSIRAASHLSKTHTAIWRTHLSAPADTYAHACQRLHLCDCVPSRQATLHTDAAKRAHAHQGARSHTSQTVSVFCCICLGTCGTDL